MFRLAQVQLIFDMMTWMGMAVPLVGLSRCLIWSVYHLLYPPGQQVYCLGGGAMNWLTGTLLYLFLVGGGVAAAFANDFLVVAMVHPAS